MRLSLRAYASVRIVFLVLALAANAFATLPSGKLIYTFRGSPDAGFPVAGLVADAAGNLYGTTIGGGTATCGCGTIFELSPPATVGGAWTEAVLYSFQGGNIDGAGPSGTLIFDQQGNLYGTTVGGSEGDGGSVFELSPPALGGSWVETVLWAFNGNDPKGGQNPYGKLVFDADGNLYGTTFYGGLHGAGTVFELVAPKIAGAPWARRVLHNFGDVANDGANPFAGLLLRGGILYGTTYNGGTVGQGMVFDLVRKPGLWTENILYNFGGSGGSYPQAGLIADSAGNLYGMAGGGGDGSCACGTVYELSPPSVAGGPWQETTVHNFTGGGDGASPAGELWRDKLDDLYGAASSGGRGLGSVFKLKPPSVSGEAWVFVFLYNFPLSDSARPGYGALILVNGAFYGTIGGGGAPGEGAVFSIVP